MTSLPSPESSPSLDPADAAAQPSRKRQRSHSMQSDTSSSSAVKRPVSDGAPQDPTVRTPDKMSSLTLADSAQEIDSYMAEQGEASIPPFLSTAPHNDPSSVENMAPADKVTFVEKAKAAAMEAGETWYLVSKRWFKRWRIACSGEVSKDGEVSEQDLGPVDNSPLLDADGDLKRDLTEGIDVEYVPEDVWTAFTTWYGQAQHSLPRRVTTRGAFAKTAFLELHPPRIKVFRLVTDAPTNLALGPPHPTIRVSIGDTVKDLCTRLADAVKTESSSIGPYRIWKLTNIDDWGTLEFPTDKLEELGADIVEESELSLEDHRIEDGDAYVVEFKGATGWLVDAEPSSKTPAIEGPPPLFDSKNSFFNRFGSSSSSTTTTATTTATATTKSLADTFSGFGTKSFTSKSYNKPLVPGTLGLGNMGNTCFMNSALQCLAHTEELAEYFLSGVFKSELNFDNPLGMHGAIAEAFGSLLQRIWASSGPSNSYSPRDFKQTLQRFAPQFSGYQQHDTQELVAFLLDGLHEDLNRVLKKPYVEKPDWEGGGDLELAKLAKASWDGYMLRNDSVIVDLFQGQYQSTLVCPECQKVSITFDPFMYLTLPLPVEKKWRHTIYYIPWDEEKPHVQIPVEIHSEASFKDLRALLGRWMEAIPENLLTMEIFSHRFYKKLDDKVAVSDMTQRDTIVCYELPCNARQGWNYKKRDDEPFILPIFLADQKNSIARTSMYSRTQPSYFGYPTVVVIQKDEASSVDAIYDKVVSRLERWTSHSRDLYQWEHTPDSEDTVTRISPHSTFTPPMESVTEITPEGDVREVTQPVAEVDLADEKNMDVDPPAEDELNTLPRPVRTKKDLFDLRIQYEYKEQGSMYGSHADKWITWEKRKEEAENFGLSSLLRDTDALYCEFDENMKQYFFGDHSNSFEHARWNDWVEFEHPELEETRKASAKKKKAGLTLEDCLDEFVKEEQLGEDDLWYCPQCKKHQQATKKFDLWKAPDILVVHLKRFSNNRVLRDKIDSFVDFPIEGLDLGDKVGERAVAKRLREQGIEVEEFKSLNLDEPLLYDLFAVDEHMGGLGGGHYRAYSVNHLNGKWYHFDDGYVTEAKATSAVNQNAYLLFYRRRSATPLGGRTSEKVREFKAAVPETQSDDAKEAQGGAAVSITEGQLPTPPSESDEPATAGNFDSRLNSLIAKMGYDPNNPMSIPGVAEMMAMAPHLSDDPPPPFEDDQSLVSDSFDTVFPYTHSYDFADRSHFRKSSPTSSNEAEVDPDFDTPTDNMWDPTYSSTYSFNIGLDDDNDGWAPRSNRGSPSYSEEASGGSPLVEEVELYSASDSITDVDVDLDSEVLEDPSETTEHDSPPPH